MRSVSWAAAVCSRGEEGTVVLATSPGIYGRTIVHRWEARVGGEGGVGDGIQHPSTHHQAPN